MVAILNRLKAHKHENLAYIRQMFKMATLFLQGGQAFKMANVQVCQRMATLNTQNQYLFKMATLTTLKRAVTAIRAARTAT